MKKWEFLNSRLFNSFLVAFLLIVVVYLTPAVIIHRISQIKENIAESQNAEDPNNPPLIKKFAFSLAEGFRQGMRGNSKTQNEKLLEFIKARPEIKISDVKLMPSSWKGHQDLMFKVENNTGKYISQIHANCVFYDDSNSVVLVDDKWLGKIKVLFPNEQVVVKESFKFVTKDPNESIIANRAEVKITKFDIVEMPNKQQQINKESPKQVD